MDELEISPENGATKKRKKDTKQTNSTNFVQVEGVVANNPETTLTFTNHGWVTIKPAIPKIDMNCIKLDFDDIQIYASPTPTDIRSRDEISVAVKDTNAYNDDVEEYLPLIASPMDTIISIKAKESWNPAFQLQLMDEGYRICYPRGCEMAYNDNHFYSLSLSEFEDYLVKYESLKEFANKRTFVLIDMANGHMKALGDAIRDSKTRFPEIVLMVGNVGHPEMYAALSEAGADYVRVGIGNGSGCLTTQQTGIGYPMASLIYECYQLSKYQTNPAKIVADGGFKKYADIVKAIALGADYVMLGSLLNKALESDSTPMAWGWVPMPNFMSARWAFRNKIPLFKKFRGMSTKEVQKIWGNKILKTSEGVSRSNKVEYTLKGWTENFVSYLKSAMSYQNCKTLEEFRGSAKYIQISPSAHDRFKK
jgi:GMP reductase